MLTGSRWRNCATVRLWGAVGLLSCKGMTVPITADVIQGFQETATFATILMNVNSPTISFIHTPLSDVVPQIQSAWIHLVRLIACATLASQGIELCALTLMNVTMANTTVQNMLPALTL